MSIAQLFSTKLGLFHQYQKNPTQYGHTIVECHLNEPFDVSVFSWNYYFLAINKARTYPNQNDCFKYVYGLRATVLYLNFPPKIYINPK